MPNSLGIARDEFQRGHGIGKAIRKGMLRRQPVIHRDHAAAGFIAQAAAEAVMGFQAPRHPAAAVEEQDARQHARRFAQG